MDFKRVESIFLIVFLGINIFLFSSYMSSKKDISHQSEIDITSDLENRLETEKITYSGELSLEKLEGSYLSAVGDDFDGVVLKELTNQTNSLEDGVLLGEFFKHKEEPIHKQAFREELNHFVYEKQNILYGSEYEVITDFSDDDTIQLYAQHWEDIPFFDEMSQLVIQLESIGAESWSVQSYEQTHLKDIEALREKQELITERDAVMSLYINNRLPADSVIKWRLLGYTSIASVRGKHVYIPAWFIAFETNKNNLEIWRINAFTGAVLSSVIPEVKK